MKSEIHNPGQPMRKEDLDHDQDSSHEAIRERLMDFSHSGKLLDSQQAGESIPFEMSAGTIPYTISVGSGIAYGRHIAGPIPASLDATILTDSVAERIVIPFADVQVGQTYRNSIGTPSLHNGTGSYKESADGLGGWVSTPESTLTRDIPVTSGSMNYIWLGYLRTVRTGAGNTTTHKVLPKTLYPFAEDGYQIVVTTTNFRPTESFISLGTVDATSPSLVITNDTSLSSEARIRGNRVEIATHTDLGPTAYSIPTGVSAHGSIRAEEHINAVGTGTVNKVNAHGIAFEDMGHAFIDVDLITHRLRHHSNGVITDNETDFTRALAPSTSAVTPVVTDAAAVFLRKLSLGHGEHALVNGGHFASVSPSLASPMGSYAVGDAYVSFPSGGAGTYAIVLKVVSGVLTAESRVAPYSIDPFLDLHICTVTWNGSAFTGITDVRVFGSISSKDLQALSVGTSELQDDSVTSGKINIADGSSAADPNTGSGVATAHLKDRLVLSKHIADADGTAASVSSSGSGVATTHLRDLVLTSQKLDLADGTSGQVTTAGSGVKTDHIQDEAVTMAKLAAALQLILTTGIAPVGSITAFGGITPPTGWYECNGQPVSRFGPGANLFAAISDYWGRGDGVNTFNVPDLRGVALRGVNGASVDTFADPDALSRIARPMGAQTSLTGVGNHVGSFQLDDLASHTHTEGSVYHAGDDRAVVGGGAASYLPAGTNTGATPTPPAGAETRMKNAYVMYIIKA